MAFVRDSDGIAAILKSAWARQQLHLRTDPMVSELPAETGVEASQIDRTTDRVVVDVAIAHPAGRAIQAKTGALTRAASAQGLEVTARPR